MEAMTKRLSYSECMKYNSFGDRFNYLYLHGANDSPRVIAEGFYKSPEWVRLRESIIRRDLGCDLAVLGCDIGGRIIVHHINPITESDLFYHPENLVDPDNLICVSYETHNQLHYMTHHDDTPYEERREGDTNLW